MKKISLFLFGLLTTILSISQTTMQMWGSTYTGGETGIGTIFTLDSNGNNLQTQYSFVTPFPGSTPYRGKLLYSNNSFWGMTTSGGNGFGVIFSWDPLTKQYTKKFDFSTNSGSSPTGGLIEYNGKFYGLTPSGGDSLKGTLFEWDIATGIFTKKYSFTNINGATPYGSLTEYNGKLYGMTNKGGANNLGVIFEWDPLTDIYRKKIDLDITKGTLPFGGFVIYNNKLYGMTSKGGVNTLGTIFEFEPLANIFTKKIDFALPFGSTPYGTMIVVGTKLFGVTRAGGIYQWGNFFDWDPVTNIITNRANVDIATTSVLFEGDPTYYNGKFYAQGFTGQKFDIIEWDPAGSTCVERSGFADDRNGANPRGTLVAHNNKLYGMASAGGLGGVGTLFEYDPATFTFTKQLDFNHSVTGANPQGSLVYMNGRYWGITITGGSDGYGTIYEFIPATGSSIAKYNFTKVNGINPGYGLTKCNGKLYGITQQGGTNRWGVLFEYDPITNIYTKKYDFNNEGPRGALTLFNNKLYGFTDKSLFEYDPQANTLNNKIAISQTLPGSIITWQMAAYNGKLYGVGGINNAGVIFEWDINTNTFTKKLDLTSPNGGSISGGLLLYNNLFYGMAGNGGANNLGCIFEWNPSNNVYTKKYDLSISTGYQVNGLTLVNGKMYGLTTRGGSYGYGTIIEWSPLTNSFQKKTDFNFINGAYPNYASLLYAPAAQQTINHCPGANTQVNSFVTGNSYQWNVNTGTGFVPIGDNSNYSGSNTVTLQLNNIPSPWYGYEYQCVVDGTAGATFKLKFVNGWTGAINSSWENPGNWSCGSLPDSNTDVVISTGASVVLNSNGICRTLNIAPGANFTVNTGYNLTVTH